MLSGPVYLTPTELLTRAPLGSIPRADVPGPFKGKVGTVTKTGASTGTIVIAGYPIDAYPVVIRVAVSGELGTAQLEISTNAGVDYSDPVLTDPNASLNTRWDHEIGITGLVISATNGTAPSFVLGNTWMCTTTASEKLVMLCGSLSDYFRKWAENTGQPVTDIDGADRDMLCHIGRMMLVSDRGDVPDYWRELDKRAREHFKLEALGDLKLNSVPDPDGFVFPDYETARAPYRNCLLARMH